MSSSSKADEIDIYWVLQPSRTRIHTGRINVCHHPHPRALLYDTDGLVKKEPSFYIIYRVVYTVLQPCRRASGFGWGVKVRYHKATMHGPWTRIGQCGSVLCLVCVHLLRSFASHSLLAPPWASALWVGRRSSSGCSAL